MTAEPFRKTHSSEEARARSSTATTTPDAREVVRILLSPTSYVSSREERAERKFSSGAESAAFVFFMVPLSLCVSAVRPSGLEPERLAATEPKPVVSAISPRAQAKGPEGPSRGHALGG